MSTDVFRRWQLTAFGSAHLHYVEAARPQPGLGQVLVRVEAAALNYRDLLLIENRLGMTPALPFTPGSDLAGTVAAVGPGVTRWRGGERVISTFAGGWFDGIRPAQATTLGSPGPGVLATHVALDAEWLVPAPATLSAAAASTLPCAALTAWTGLIEDGALHAGQTVLIHGTGGVALFGLQFARMHGARVIVVSGDAGKRAQVLSLGAAHALERAADWPSEVRRLSGGRGADQVLETVGGAHLGRSLAAAAPGAHVALIGVLDGAELGGSSFDLMLNLVIVQGVMVGHRSALERMVRAIDINALQPVIAAEYPATELPAALAHLARGPFGKVVLRFA